MALSAGLQATCDTKLDDVVSQLSTLQETYKTETVVEGDVSYVRNRYWQGIAVVNGVPVDGAELAVDMTKSPTDQAEDWTDVGVTLAATLPLTIEVHTYDGPSGKGYVVCGTVKETDGQQVVRTYCRAVNVGPETDRAHGWTDITPE